MPLPAAPPSPQRLALAFIAAPMAAATLVGLLALIASGDAAVAISYAGASLLPALAATLLIGLPAHLLLRRRLRPTLNRALAAGALIGMTPVLVIFLGPILALGGRVTNATDGLLPILALAAVAALIGALAGWLFWAVAVWRPEAE